MLLRSLRVPSSLLLLVAFLVFFGWQLCQGFRHEHGPIGSQVIPGKAHCAHDFCDGAALVSAFVPQEQSS
jgi:hypothetical protein